MNFAESLALKAVSLLLALILWVTILSLKPEERTYSPKLEPKFAPGMALISALPEVKFTYQGSRIALKDFEAKAKEDKSFDLNPRETVVEIQTKDLAPQLPKGIKLISYSPATLVYRLEERAERAIPVKPNFTGQPADGFEMGTIKVEPPKAVVSGAKSYVTALDFVETLACDITGLKDEVMKCSTKFTVEPGFIVQGEAVQVFITGRRSK